MEKKFLNETGLSRFLNNIKNIFAPIVHKHTKSQITDFPDIATVDELKDYFGTIDENGGQASTSSLPAVSAEDDGKFLRVVNGTWQAVAIPNAEEDEF